MKTTIEAVQGNLSCGSRSPQTSESTEGSDYLDLQRLFAPWAYV